MEDNPYRDEDCIICYKCNDPFNPDVNGNGKICDSCILEKI